MASVTLCSDFGAQENKVCHCSYIPMPSYLPWSKGTSCHDLCIECWVLGQLFHSSLSLFHQEALQFLFTFCHTGVVICISGYWYFSWQSRSQLVLHPARHFTWCPLQYHYIKYWLSLYEVLIITIWSTETKQDPVGLLKTEVFSCPSFLLCRE